MEMCVCAYIYMYSTYMDIYTGTVYIYIYTHTTHSVYICGLGSSMS